MSAHSSATLTTEPAAPLRRQPLSILQSSASSTESPTTNSQFGITAEFSPARSPSSARVCLDSRSKLEIYYDISINIT